MLDTTKELLLLLCVQYRRDIISTCRQSSRGEFVVVVVLSFPCFSCFGSLPIVLKLLPFFFFLPYREQRPQQHSTRWEKEEEEEEEEEKSHDFPFAFSFSSRVDEYQRVWNKQHTHTWNIWRWEQTALVCSAHRQAFPVPPPLRRVFSSLSFSSPSAVHFAQCTAIAEKEVECFYSGVILLKKKKIERNKASPCFEWNVPEKRRLFLLFSLLLPFSELIAWNLLRRSRKAMQFIKQNPFKQFCFDASSIVYYY